MGELYFKVVNAEETAYEFLNYTNGEDICGELEDHAGLMGVIRGGHHAGLSWYVALINPTDIAGPGLLTLIYEQPPHAKVMKLVFDILDKLNINAQSVGRPTPEDYPILYDRLESI